MVHTSLSFSPKSFGDIAAAFARQTPNASPNSATNERALLGQSCRKFFRRLLKYVRLKGNLKYEPKESCDNFSLPGLETQCKYRRGDRGKNFSEIFLAAAVVMCQIQPTRK
jgi:hypothetical protein